MSVNRFLIALGGCFLAASAAWADDIGFVDCSNHSDETQVFAKARKSPEVVGSVPCGERFTILVYGFVFSRIQTKDGNVGYVYSNIISVDRNLTALQRSPSTTPQISEAKMKVPVSNAPVTRPAAAAKPQIDASLPPAAATSAPASSVAAANTAPTTPAAAQPAKDLLAQTESASAQPVSTSAPQPAAQAPAPASDTAEIVMHSAPPTPAQPEPSPAQPASSSASSAPSAAPAVEPAPVPAAAAQPEPSAPAQPAPAAKSAEPAAAPAIRPADTRSTWEKPNPGGRNAPLIELFGGGAFSRMSGGGSGSNMIGALGSFGWNFKPWLQIVGDSSYNTVTYSGTKNVLYGNHYGPRYFYRTRNRWHLTPFAEGFVGVSRLDSTVTGTGGYTTSANGMSFKFGGGVDYRPSRRLEIRLFDVDYYRTSFGANVYQTNYWISSGIVLRLFGGNSD